MQEYMAIPFHIHSSRLRPPEPRDDVREPSGSWSKRLRWKSPCGKPSMPTAEIPRDSRLSSETAISLSGKFKQVLALSE